MSRCGYVCLVPAPLWWCDSQRRRVAVAASARALGYVQLLPAYQSACSWLRGCLGSLFQMCLLPWCMVNVIWVVVVVLVAFGSRLDGHKGVSGGCSS